MILAWDNKVDSAIVTAGSEIATLPASNVKTPHLAEKWHTAAGVKSSYLLFDLGAKPACSMLALLGTNLSETTQLRVRASPTDAEVDADVLFDTGAINAAPLKCLVIPAQSAGYASTPDSPSLSVLGDIDIRAKVALDDWTPSSINRIVNKYSEGGNQRSYMLRVLTSGLLEFDWSEDGAADKTAQSTVAVGAAAAEIKWIRATLKVNNGAAGRDIKFWTSNNYDPETDTGTWTQLGATVTQAGATSIFNGNDQLYIGTSGSETVVGKVFYAEVRNGIDGPVVASFNPAKDAIVGASSFTSSRTRELWTVTQSGTRKVSIAIPSHANLKAGYGALYKTLSLPFLHLPGIAGNYASTPDSAATSIVGDLDIRMKVRANDWSPPVLSPFLLSKWVTTGNQRSYRLFMDNGTGRLRINYSTTGANEVLITSTVGVAFAEDTTYWVRVTLDVDNGAAGHDVKFWTSADYDPTTNSGTWTQLGTTVTTAGVIAMFNSTAPVELGASSAAASNDWLGAIYYAEIRNGIDGAVVAAFDPARASSSGVTTITADTGEVWTVNQAGNLKAELLKVDPRARYWRVDLTDNTLADNLQVGRVFIGPSFKHSGTLRYGWGANPLDESENDESYGGQDYPESLPKRRVLSFTLDYLTEAEMYGNLFAMARANGTVKDVLAVPHEDGEYVSEQAVWGRLQALKPIVRNAARIFQAPFIVRERL